MPAKTKQVQAKKPDEISERDCFETPRYATQLLIPYLHTVRSRLGVIWECAAGNGRISKVLLEDGHPVASSDLKQGVNFLIYDEEVTFNYGSIVTNPPFSLKEEFVRMALRYDLPFAFLIPFDMNGWLCEAFDKWECEGLVPTRRINYITPRTLQRIHEGEIWNTYIKPKFGDRAKNLKEFQEKFAVSWNIALEEYDDFHNYKSVDDAPKELLHKYSSSDFHSFWLTRYLNLPKQLTFVDLPIASIKNNI